MAAAKTTIKGFGMIGILLIIAVLLILGAGLAKITLNSLVLADEKVSSLQAFYLAEAGIEKIKYELKNNPGWYTDLRHSPADDIDWIKDLSHGKSFAGQTCGTFKMVREKDRSRAYAVGFSKRSVKIIKLDFSLLPFKPLGWTLL